jgi:transposase
MTSILYVGMDVHTTSYTLCCYSMEEDKAYGENQVDPDYRNILKYLKQVSKGKENSEIVCGYEAGSLGYSLYEELTKSGVKCVILAPTSMPTSKRTKRIKTDKRDAQNIARCLAYKTYSAVHIPTEEDNAVREYIRMRNDVKDALKKTKQQLLAFCTRHGKQYNDGSKWTIKHQKWLRGLKFGNAVLQETLQEYMILYNQACEKIKVYDKRIEEMARREEYAERVKKLTCFIGIKEHTALSVIVEVGDFKRFAKAENCASYLGLVPGEESSGQTIRRTRITKAGNVHVRKLLVEAAQCYTRGAIGRKSKELLNRQAGNDPKVIAYADRANERMKRKFYRMQFRTKRNIGVVAVARELACFIWGMMTDNLA